MTSMNALLRLHTYGAPAMPPGVHVSTLYRGVFLPAGVYARLTDEGDYTEKGFAAFTFSREEAVSYARTGRDERGFDGGKMVVFELDVRDIPRGTPWIWFWPKKSRTNRVVHMGNDVHQVVMPPSTLEVERKAGDPRYPGVRFFRAKVTEVADRYVRRPRRKGADADPADAMPLHALFDPAPPRGHHRKRQRT
jgi:hypothetical protein